MKKFCLLLLAIMSVTVMLAQPANDNLCDATALTLDADCSATLPYDNTAATTQIGEATGTCFGEGTIEQTVWFTFVAPSTGAVSITTDFANSGMQDNQMAVYELDGTTDCTEIVNLVEVACNEDLVPQPVNTMFNAAVPPIPVTSGNTYYIQVDGYNDGTTISEGTFCIMVSTITPPNNDYCASADNYGGFGPTCTKVFDGTTIGATAGNGLDVFSCDGTPFNASVYYELTAGVAEVEFNLLTGENINVSLLTSSATCDAGGSTGSIEVSGNCFTDIDVSATADPMDADRLFTSLTPMTPYLLAIWTDEGEETDFSFCLSRAPAYECGDNVCYALAENYTDCPGDCPCESSIDFFNYATGADSDAPYAVCPEIVNGTTDDDNPGIYVPFTVTTLDSDLEGSMVSSNTGTLFTSTTPPTPLPNNEATNFLKYLFLTDAEIAAGGSITISFTSDMGACAAEATFSIADLMSNSPAPADCGGCDLVIIADYTATTCGADGTAPTPLTVQNAVGPNVWLSLDGNTTFDPDDDAFPLSLTGPTTIPFGDNDGTFTFYDSGKPNCATRVTIYTGDFNCSPSEECTVEGGLSTNCRLDSEVSVSSAPVTCNEDGTLNIPIDIGRTTGTVTFSPDVAGGSGSEGDPFTVTVDPNNCQTLDFSVSDESTCGITPIVTINSPASLAGGVDVGTNGTTWGLQIATELGICGTDTSVVGTLAVLNDGDTAGGQLTDFCEPDPTDPMAPAPAASVCAPIAGKIAMIDRGQCNFTSKIENAEACGAIGVIICNCQVGPSWCAATADELMSMGAAADYMGDIGIPAVFMLYSKCEEIKAAMNNGIDVEACIGAPEVIVGCDRDYSLDVCADYTTQACDDGNACTDGDTETVDATGASVCACTGTEIVCADGETLNPDTCMCESDCVPPTEPETECYETATFNDAACMWEVTGDAPVEPTDLECYETAAFDDATCAWVVSGEMPAEPTLACYETASFNETTCVWDVIGDAPAEPTDLECYQTATFDDATCAWVVDGEMPAEPSGLACYETATFNTGTCVWDVEGTEPTEPTTACYETAAFNETSCMWDVTGDQPEQPTDIACYQTVGAFDDATCMWQVNGEQPDVDDNCDQTEDSFDETTCMVVNTSLCGEGTTLDEVLCECTTDVVMGCTDECASNYDPMANSDDGSCMLPEEPETACYETATFNDTTCMWEVTGDQPDPPTVACYETATFDDDVCDYVITGEQPAEPTDLACYESVDSFDDATCAWVVTGDQPEPPTDLACYQSADTFDDATCAWVVTGEQPDVDDACEFTDDSFDEVACEVVNTPNCAAGTTFNASACACDTDPVDGCTDPCAPNYNADANTDDGSCEDYSTECNTVCADGDLEVWDAETCACVVETATVLGCTDDTATNYNADANCDDDSCEFDTTVEGCTDSCAPNYNADANEDDGSCEAYSTDCNQDCTAGPFGGTWDAASCACIDETEAVSGCTDDTATNYNADANCDDDSCEFDTTVEGCTDSCAPNYNADANADDGSCEDYSTDCNTDCAAGDIQAWDADSCSCVTETATVLGCTNSAATNYNADANCDDGSCITDVECNPPSAGDFNCDE